MAETTNWLEIPTVEDHLKEATRIVGQFAEASFDEWMRDQLASPRLSAGAQLESPLEALFYLWWNAIAGPDSQWYFKLALVPQQEVVVQDERFRLDFVVDLNVEYEESFGGGWPDMAAYRGGG